MIEHFFDGLKLLWDIAIFRYAVFANISIITFVFVRRLTAAYHSQGSFFSPYRIYKGEFCIHNALYLRQRNIPLNEIKRIEVHCAHGRGGKIYILNIERKNGKPTGSVIFGKSKRNDRLLEKLEEDAQKYHIQISKETWD
ncbi:hypothetical protein LK430_08455 [Acidaminococcus fermentans DSM 20731]|uniref:Uncharacterized protein n=1 Tax=Acidaminococcus fermentans (strain ATCC 25085 / DSM 20731 / CCUG 9996 / CIP 106432 / VR4) TaxID=591001 RepID=D2RKB0_ACIFV|nr:hypothetical protein [Acidaminococcus fermentans]ADB47512.1 hypothetical protein Acfer_1147 [Acidaminococcus fermentans DSM 20731]UEA71872.1 hypothetical protein LK430_08455 [Acidaminococcus fermentans DSM 20731]